MIVPIVPQACYWTYCSYLGIWKKNIKEKYALKLIRWETRKLVKPFCKDLVSRELLLNKKSLDNSYLTQIWPITLLVSIYLHRINKINFLILYDTLNPSEYPLRFLHIIFDRLLYRNIIHLYLSYRFDESKCYILHIVNILHLLNTSHSCLI